MKRSVCLDRPREPKFRLGKLTATVKALKCVSQMEIITALLRHACGDWGDIEEEDKNANDVALLSGNPLLSAYTTRRGLPFLVLTEADQSATTIFLPGEL